MLLVSWVERSWDDSNRKKCKVDLLGKRHPYRTVFVSFHFEGEPRNDQILWTWLQINWLRRNSTCSFPEGWLILSYLDCLHGCSDWINQPVMTHSRRSPSGVATSHSECPPAKFMSVPLPGGMLCKGRQLWLWKWSCLFLALISFQDRFLWSKRGESKRETLALRYIKAKCKYVLLN